jgi:beta-lactamase regulating signal transducer with metallopeptidase domain
MNALIESLNLWGSHAIRFAWPILWQSSLLISVIFALDFSLRRKIRPVVRYALWLVVLVKLLLPPSLAFPTGVGWWVRSSAPPALIPTTPSFVLTQSVAPEPMLPTDALPRLTRPSLPRPHLSFAGGAFVSSIALSLGLLLWMLWRWRQVARDVERASAAPDWLKDLLVATQRQAALRRSVRLRLTEKVMSPAVCGLLRPVILLPRSLSEKLPLAQLQAVLLHELIHLRRGDVVVNCAQALLQIVYWWHPLLWLANARIRRLREEAVDDAVMLALRDEAECYAPTLLEVARLAFPRPLASLGLVGILESKHALRQRIERLVNFVPPRRAGLSFGALLGILAFTAIALPQAEPPPKPAKAMGNSGSAGHATENQKTEVNGTNSASWEIETLTLDGKAQYDVATGLATASNGVRLKCSGTVLTADRATVNQKTGEVTVDGAVLIYCDGQVLSGEHARLDGKLLTSNPAVLIFRSNGTNLTFSRKGCQAIITKLDHIRLDHVYFDSLPLSEVILILGDESKKRDPNKRGINFITNPSADTETAEISSVPITIKPELRDVPLADVLEAIVKVSGKPIKYSIEDYAVVFSFKGKGQEPLYTRTFKVDPNTFLGRLRKRSGLAGSDDSWELYAAIRKFFSHAGVDLKPPKSVYFADRRGELLVRATVEDLGRIGGAIQKLNAAQDDARIKFKQFIEGDAQAHAAYYSIERYADASPKTGKDPTPLYTRFYRIDMKTALTWLRKQEGISAAYGEAELQIAARNFFTDAGVDFKPPNAFFLDASNRVLVVRSRPEDLEKIEAAIQKLNAAPPRVQIRLQLFELTNSLGLDAYLGSSIMQSPAFKGFSPTKGGVLTEPQYRAVLRAMENREGAEQVTDQTVTTQSGRQTRVKVQKPDQELELYEGHGVLVEHER